MACDLWRGKIDAYADAELSADEMSRLDAHLRGCAPCTSDLLSRVQLKSAIQSAGRRFSASPGLRDRVQKTLPTRTSGIRAWSWMTKLAAAAALVALGFLGLRHWSSREAELVFAELADLHVATLASSNPVDVISSDRHTVKPWFQGKLPFTFNLPELGGSPFTLIGGRVTYLAQAPGAQLIFSIGKHRLSVFIFPNQPDRRLGFTDSRSRHRTFNVESWSENELRFFIIGDANLDDIHKLRELLMDCNN